MTKYCIAGCLLLSLVMCGLNVVTALVGTKSSESASSSHSGENGSPNRPSCANISNCVKVTCLNPRNPLCLACTPGYYRMGLLIAKECAKCGAVPNCLQVQCTNRLDHRCAVCKPGYYGPSCTRCADVRLCNQVTCTNAMDQKCVNCIGGFYGPTCSRCNSLPNCIGQITCSNSTNQQCQTCNYGYYGPSCAACNGVANCAGPVTCITADDQQCSGCNCGYYGPTCTACSPIANCIGSVTCSSSSNHQCSKCDAGFYGPQCAQCVAITGCVGQVTCNSATDSQCSQCAAGYYGPQCARDGGLGSWASWTECSASCGGGTTTRTRLCDNPPPANGGKDCTDTVSEQSTCKTSACPMPDPINDCAKSPCLSGTCEDLTGGYFCRCPVNDSTCEDVKVCNVIADLVFIVDESGSVGAVNFQSVRDFFSDITEQFPSGMQVGAVAFSTGARMAVNFTDPTSAKTQIRALSYLGGSTFISKGLANARSMLASGRDGTEKFIVLFTDGQTAATDVQATKSNATAAKNDGIKIISIGVTSNIDVPLLTEISHDYHNFLWVREFSNMVLTIWNEYQDC